MIIRTLKHSVIFLSMRAILIFVVLQLISVAWSQPCVHTKSGYFCKEIPRDYPARLTSLIIFASALGEIDLTMFNSTNLTSVTSLSITQSGVTAVAPQTFDQFHNLKTLILDNNDVSHVSSDWFSHCGALETLTLSNNKITMLDHNSVSGLTNLHTLNLSQNQINTITPSSFLNISKLRQLDLSSNILTHLSVDVLLPLNTTKIRLDGNPWDCSCSVQDFAKFLRGLQNASLLENEMLVCCSSPPELKGKPVWQEPECKILTTTTTSHPSERPPTGGPAVANSTSVTQTTDRPASTNKPLTIGRPTLISLIVVLCALVLVICVLSVLYHRKQQRKYLQVVKPSPDNKESVKTGETTGMNNKGETRVKLPEQTQNTTTEMLLRTNQREAEGEMMSQIWHIYSSGIYQSREPMKRVSSAGPVLCRTQEVFPKQTEAGAAAEELDVEKNSEYYGGWMTSEQQNEDVTVNVEDVCGEVEQQKVGEKRADLDEENRSTDDEVSIFMEMQGSRGDGLRESYVETDKTAKTETSVDKEIPHHFSQVMTTEEHLNNELMGDAGNSHDIPQGKQNTGQSVENENAENLPYLTIGADPENQTSVSKQSTATGMSRPWPVRPIRRVLSWPPTAAQWKKQWVQNQQVLNVFPKLIFVTGYQQFQHSICPTTFPAAPQLNALEFLPENALPQEVVRASIDGDPYWGNAESSTPKFLHFNAQESMTGNLSQRMDARIISNGETWRSGFKSSTLSSFFSKKSSDESEVCSALFTVLHPSASGSNLKPASGEINNTDNLKKTQSLRKMRRQVRRHEQITSKKKPSRRAGQAAVRASNCDQQRQVCKDSTAPPSGGSTKDNSLLDLLHEVVENHGRWTRERWRQTQINKHKLKQQEQSH